MASGSNYLTTYYAKRIIGDTAAADKLSALLQTGANIASDTWILHRTNRASTYGIKYLFDTTTTTTPSQVEGEDPIVTDNQHDRIELYGGQTETVSNVTTDVPSAWVQLDTGDLYVSGNVGIGYEPDTYKLYVNGTSCFTNTITIDNGCVNGEVIRIIGAANKVFSVKLSGDQTPGSNVDIGWNWTNVEGAGAAFRSASFPSQEGEFRIYARKRNSSDVAVYTQLIGTPGDANNGGVLSWGGKVDIGVNSTTPTSQLTVTGPNSGSLPLIKLNPSGTVNWQRGVQMLNSGMVQGNQLMYCVGQADSSKNMGQMYFYYNASGDNANRLSFGLHSVDDAFNITGAGYITSGDTVQFSNTTSWGKGTMIVGKNGTDKVVIGYEAGTVTGAVVGAHASTCTAWATLNVSGSSINFRMSDTLVAKILDGCLSLFPTSTNYREGLRIHSKSDWSDITLCGNDLTGDSGISANSWFIGNNNGNFYIARNGSPGTTAYLSCVSNGWNFLNSVTFGARVTSTAPSAITGVDRIIITPYYHTGGPWKITSRDDASNAYLSLYYSTTETARMQHNGALLLCNNISFTNSGTAFRGINYGTMGDNDQWRIGGAATAANSGYMELATADDGNEPIYVRQYTGVFTTVKRTLTLLDADGNSTFPGNIHISHATSATMTADSTNPKITFSESGTQPVHLIYTDYDSYRAPAGLKVVGGANASAAWFEVEGQCYAAGFNGPLSGNASTATTWQTARTLTIGGTGKSVNGSANVSWSKAEILGSSTNANFYRGDQTWSSTLGGSIYINGLVYSTANSIQAVFGAQNNGWVHFTNNGGKNWYFDHPIHAVTGFTVYNTSTSLTNNNLTFASGGGWYMSDTTWIRAVGSKSVYTGSGALRSDGSVWGCKVTLQDNWVGFYSANQSGSRYGFIQCNNNRMYFRKENGVSTYHFDMDGGYLYTSRCYNAVWNDYAECRNTATEEPGRCVMESITGQMQLTTSRLQSGCKIISDTYGTCIGATDEIKTPIAVSGRVLAYPYRNREEYPLGAAVCSAPNGTVDIMTRDEIMMYPERIVGTVSEIPDYEIWHCGSKELKEEIQVNGRIWIYVR